MSRLILIGLAGSGKTTLGRMAAQALALPFYDCDDRVSRAAGMTIPDIFARRGEPYFRALEREALQELCRREDCVIATGGGGVLLPENRALLRRSGTVLWLDRDVERILQTDFSAGRPLLGQGAPALARLAAERRELYDACAHHRIPDGDVNAVLSEILRIWREEHP